MADYARIRVRAEYSKNADYSSPKIDHEFTSQETTPSKYDFREVSAGTGGTTVDLGAYTTIDDCIIHNLDSTNYVDATFRNTANGATDNIIRVDKGAILSVGELTVANDLVLTANGAAVNCEILLLGT
jgi:hypothetical protein